MSHRIVAKEEKYKSHIFTVESVSVELPDQRVRHYDLIQIQDAVTILPIDDDGNVLFVKQFRIGANKMVLELPAGKIETGEEPLATAEREIREETGMAAKKMRPLGKFYVSPGYSTEFMYTFLATGLYTSPLDPDADEFINLVKIPLPEVMAMLQKSEIEDAKTLATFVQALPFIGTLRA
ncbi:MAG: NUDIX hydrolase [Anaerolineaceae bacterium]|nr:NUDIX hydrolase [Anaerolineaceae bacterium]